MRVRWPILFASLAACAALTALAAWILDWSFQRAATLSPVIVVVAGGIAFLVVLWTRVALDGFRTRRKRP